MIRLVSQQADCSTIDPQAIGTAASKAILAPVIACSLAFTTDWKYDLHDGTGWHSCPDQGFFDPPMRVRGFSISDTTNTSRAITYDLAGTGLTNTDGNPQYAKYSSEIYEQLATNVRHVGQVTRVYLNSRLTDATYITFLG